MKKIYCLFLSMIVAIGFTSCNDEWKDEQFVHTVSFKANPNEQGVTEAYVRYKPGGVVRYSLPVILSGSTMNSQNLSVKVDLDPDTLETLNKNIYGHREELYFLQLGRQYYNMPETIEFPAGECVTTLPIDFKLSGDLDQADKFVLPLQIVDDSSLGYDANPRKHYRRAMLRLMPFNDYSGTYDAAQYKIYIDNDANNLFTISNSRAYVVDDRTIFIYAGMRDIEFLDRKLYKIFIEFPEDKEDKMLRIYTNNEELELEIDPKVQPYYTQVEDMDELRPYLKKVYISINLKYSFVDYTTIPGQKIKYTVDGSLSMRRNLNTLIPDEDQQIEW